MLLTASQKRLHLYDYVLDLTYNSDILKNVNNDKVLGALIDNNMVNPYAVYCKENFFKFLASIKTEKSFSHLRIEYNFIGLIFNLTSIISPQYGDERLISTPTEYTDYKNGLIKSFKTMSIRILQAV